MIVPARDVEAHIGSALTALAAQRTRREWELVVVDDGSRDATAAIVERAGGRARLIRGPGAGAAAARNMGAAAARGRVLAFTDADCAPAPDWLDAALSAIDAGHDLVQGQVIAAPGVPIGPWDRTVWVQSEYGLYETANLIVRRELFERVGGFIAPFHHSGRPLGEDVYFGWRARRAGGRTTFAADAVVHHAVLPGRAREYVAERARLRYFPAIVRHVPELRESFAWRRWFLNERTARLDLALAGLLLAGVARRPWPLLAALPYAMSVRDHVRGAGGDPLAVASAEVVADLVGAAGLVAGSARSRTLLL